MTKQEAVDKLIQIAKAETGYLEKKSNSNLEDKTANAGSNNYTKYWQDIYPEYQGQAWCACFVTWCFVQAFGKAMAEKLLKHYPYVYCPTMSRLFTLNENPKVGDIVIFYRNNTFAHTGIVTDVDGDMFKTVEGNTSGGSSIVANGGGVFAKSYYTSNLPGTKFCTPDYSILEEEIDMNELNALKTEVETLTKEVNNLKNKMVYNYIDDNLPCFARATVEKLVSKGYLKGDENGLNLTDELLRILVINDRAGVYGE